MSSRSKSRVKRVRIRNFQALGDVSIELGNVTVIKGSSDIGKSAIVRSIAGLLRNSVNKSHIRSGQQATLIEVETDKALVSFSRSTKSSASYTVKYNGEEETLHTKCGKIVPPEVHEALGIKPFDLDTDVSVMPNVSMQFGGQFPIDQSSSVISKLLGRISNLNIVFAAIRLLNAAEATKTAEISATEAIIAMKQRQLQQFTAVEAQEQCMEVLVEKNKSVASLKERHARLIIIANDIVTSKNELVIAKRSQLAGDIIMQIAATSSRKASKLGAAKKLYVELSQYDGNAKKFTDVDKASALVFILRDDAERKANELKLAKDLLRDISRIRLDHNTMVKDTKVKVEEQEVLKRQAEDLIESQDLCPLIKKSWASGCKELLRDSI